MAAVNVGVLLLVAGPSAGWAPAVGWWLAGLGLGSFVPLAVVALVAATRRVTVPGQPDRLAARASAPLPRRQAVKTRPARATSLSSIKPMEEGGGGGDGERGERCGR